MSVINRIEIVNFLNTNGEREQAPWEPKYRQVVLEMRGQSTAINMINGCGKTSIAEAITGMLARDSQLIGRTRTKMAPAKTNMYSHFRIEFLVATRNISQRDLLLDDDPRTGEAWVFGMCGFRGANEHSYFYYYPGRLEDTPLAQRAGNKVTLFGNNVLKQYREKVDGFEWGLDTESWKAALADHISTQVMQRNAQYQKMGAGDKSAELFNVKPRRGEAFDAAFFYEVLAPELLSGLMDEEGEDGEFDFEDTVINTINRVLAAKHNTERKGEELQRAKQALDAVSETTKKATACAGARTAYQTKLTEVAKNARLLRELAIALPGVPRHLCPEGLAGRIFPHLVIEPGKGLHILDQGLSLLVGREVNRINELAGRQGIRRGKPSQMIELGSDPDSAAPPRGGHGSTSYSLSDARQLLARSNAFAQGITLQAANEALATAARWFEEKCDTHPYRPQLLAKEREFERHTDEVAELQREIDAANQRLTTLDNQERDFKDNESYYNHLAASGLFTIDELTAPSQAKRAVASDFEAAQKAQQSFDRRLAQLETHLLHWQAFCKSYGDNADPEATHTELANQETAAQKTIDMLRQEIRENLTAQKNSQSELTEEQAALRRAAEQVEEFNALAPLMAEYRRRFGDAEATTLDRTVASRLIELRTEIKNAKPDLTRLSEQVGFINAFHAEHGPDAVPVAILAGWEAERERLLLDKQDLSEVIESLIRRRSQLDSAQVAAGDTAQLALDMLCDAGIAFSPVHAVIDGLKLESTRKRKALSSLSALLFAPVIDHPREAARASALLQQKELPLPIFLTERFVEYVRHSDLALLEDPPATYGLIAGIPTRAVECLLDPALVEREKTSLDAEIKKSQQRQQTLVAKLRSLEPEAVRVQQVRRAADALKTNAQHEHARLEDQLKRWQEELPLAEENASESAIMAIRSMQRFTALGGETGRQRADNERHRAAESAKRITDHLEVLLHKEERISGNLKAEEARLPTIYPPPLRAQLQSAIAFADDNGPAFMANADQERIHLQQTLDRATNRQRFSELFDRAQQYLDTKQRASEYIAEMTRLRAFVPEAENRLQIARRAIQCLKEELPALQERVEAIDLMVAEALAQYRHVSALREEISADTASSDTNDTPVGQALAVFHATLAGNGASDDVVGVASAVTQALKGLDLRSDAIELKGLRTTFTGAEADFVKAVQELRSESSDLAPTEREHLMSIRDYRGVELVAAMEQRLRVIYEEGQQAFSVAKAAEHDNRQRAAERMTYFIRSANANLDTLKKVAKREHGRHKAHFLVDATMASKEEASALVDSILDKLDTYRRSEAELERKGLADDQDKQRRRQRDIIREFAYRHIFRNPEVLYVNRTIRQTGEPHALNPGALSGGQRTAISLMWMVRLADYAIAREIQRLSSSRVRGKALARSENILIIDGLFSDLSDPKLIESAMSGIEDTRGRFQLIGLIHDPKYQNDFNVFPVLLQGKERVSPGGGHGWVQIEQGVPTAAPHKGSVDVAGLRVVPADSRTAEPEEGDA